MDVAVQKKRLFVMLAVCGVCTLVALVSIVGNLVFNVRWMMWTFLAAIGAGFLAQGWLMVGLAKATKAAKTEKERGQ